MKLLDPALTLLAHDLEPVTLLPQEEVEVPGQPVQSIYFPENCIVSLASQVGTRSADIGVVGREGMTGVGVLLGDDRGSLLTVVRIGGPALRISVDLLRKASSVAPAVAGHLSRYARSLQIQLATTAVANAQTKVEARVARLLLMYGDRLHGGSLKVTHELAALAIGARRPGVTTALQALESKGAISARRREIVITDRDRLVELAAGSYGYAEAEHARLLGAAA